MPIPSTEAAVLDEAVSKYRSGQVGRDLRARATGHAGYWNRPDETAKVFTADGWLRTGDMGFMDERGYFKITDRKKDMIVVSGFKVFPNEVEDVVMMHAGVLEAAAIGVADAKSGEAVKIVVVRKDPALTEQALLEHCKKNLTALQGPEDHRIPDRAPPEIQYRKDPAPPAARDRGGIRRLGWRMPAGVRPQLAADRGVGDHEADRVGDFLGRISRPSCVYGRMFLSM